MKNQIVNHKQGFTSYNFNLLNDKQRQDIMNEFDSNIMHIGISDNKDDIKVLTKTGELHVLTLSLIGIKTDKIF